MKILFSKNNNWNGFQLLSSMGIHESNQLWISELCLKMLTVSNWSKKIIEDELAASSDLKTILSQKTTKKKISTRDKNSTRTLNFNNVIKEPELGVIYNLIKFLELFYLQNYQILVRTRNILKWKKCNCHLSKWSGLLEKYYINVVVVSLL